MAKAKDAFADATKIAYRVIVQQIRSDGQVREESADVPPVGLSGPVVVGGLTERHHQELDARFRDALVESTRTVLPELYERFHK